MWFVEVGEMKYIGGVTGKRSIMKKLIIILMAALLVVMLAGCKKKVQEQIDLSEEYCETLDAEVEIGTVKLGAVVHRLTSNGGRLSVFWCPAANFESKPSPEELVAASLNSDEKLLSRRTVTPSAAITAKSNPSPPLRLRRSPPEIEKAPHFKGGAFYNNILHSSRRSHRPALAR